MNKYRICPECKQPKAYIMGLRNDEIYVLCDNPECNFDKGPFDMVEKAKDEWNKLEELN